MEQLAKVLTIRQTPRDTAASQTTNLGSAYRTCLDRWKEMSPLEREETERRALESIKIGIESTIRDKDRRSYTSLLESDWRVNFEGLKVIDQNRKSFERLRKWSPEMKKGVVLYGPVGTGKSTACKAIINQFASPNYRCLFINIADAMQALKDTIDDPMKSMGDEKQKLIRPSLLILDDLGAEKSTEWAREKIFSIFEARCKHGKHTFFTTNLDPDDVAKVYKERIHDRMVEFCSWVQFPGKSWRKMSFVSEI